MAGCMTMTATHVTLNFDTFQHTLQFQLMLHALCLIYRNTQYCFISSVDTPKAILQVAKKLTYHIKRGLTNKSEINF